MKSVSVICAAVLSATVLMPSGAMANIDTIRNSNSAFYGSLGLGFLNYKERIPVYTDSERGLMPAVGLGISYMSPNSNMWYALDGSMTIGDENYRGWLIDYSASPVSYTPYEGTTHTMILRADGKIGKGIELSKSVMLTPYFDVGFRYWSRDLETFVEKYQHLETLLGLMAQWSPTQRVVLTTYGAAGVQFLGNMHALDRDFEPGSAGVYKAGAKVGFNLTKRWELFTALDYDYFRYTASDPVGPSLSPSDPTMIPYEPGSYTSETTWRVGLAYHMR
ncbi:MAG: hypothetical protein PHW76_04480 [Alphaproteobacteria bacterium]|nr:hypothetical protein [Alphaproteobacteria bacterium]